MVTYASPVSGTPENPERSDSLTPGFSHLDELPEFKKNVPNIMFYLPHLLSRLMLVAAMTPALRVFIKLWKNQGCNLLESLRLKTEN